MPDRRPCLIVYDSADLKRQQRVCKLLRGYFPGGQKSCFEYCFISAEYDYVPVQLHSLIEPGSGNCISFAYLPEATRIS